MKKAVGFIFMVFCFTSVIAQNKTTTELKHVVIFAFKESSTKDQVADVVKSFTGLYGVVPQIKKMEWGLNISPEHLDQGFTHCFILTFDSEKDLADYQQHPAHNHFQAILKPHMAKVFVVDYFVSAK